MSNRVSLGEIPVGPVVPFEVHEAGKMAMSRTQVLDDGDTASDPAMFQAMPKV